jgi:18S rRNA (adenine1779-N6/adenine1780-N6)-dimethyltransferase
MQSSNQQ